MASSVLGKRRRHATLIEDSPSPFCSAKRRAPNSPPSIHTENEGPSKLQTRHEAPLLMDLDGPQHNTPDSTRRSATRNVSSKRIVRNIQAAVTCIKSNISTRLTESFADENATPPPFQTPTTTRFRDALSAANTETPKHRVRLVGKPLAPGTPRTLSTPSSKATTVYATARNAFSQSSSPRKIVGRDSERQSLRSFISDAVRLKSGGCTYVSGPPGTGKSALVEEIATEFRSRPSVRVAYINCVTIKSSNDVYSKLAQELCLDGEFNGGSEKARLSSVFLSKQRMVADAYLVLLDEIDSLLDTDCEAIYGLFEAALHRSSHLILIGIANALDLTDRFLPRLKARNLKPQLLPFLPYTAPQIALIITEVLRSTMPPDPAAANGFVPFLHPAAIQFCSKKVASQSGDLRKAFNLVGRAIDLVERETRDKSIAAATPSPMKQPLAELSNLSNALPPTPPTSSPLKPSSPTLSLTALTPESAPRATVAHVARLASIIFNNGTTARLAGLNLQQKAVLCSLTAAERRKAVRDPFTTPTKSVNKAPTVKSLYATYAMLCLKDEGVLQPLKSTEFRDVVASLETLGLVHESNGRTTSFLTPSRTPSRNGRNADEKQVASAVSEKELLDSLKGPGGDLLRSLLGAS